MTATNWRNVLSECLNTLEREQIGSPCPVVDHEIARGAVGGPDDITVWLICRNRAEQRQFTDSELARTASMLRKKMLAAGFPEETVTALAVRATSREEVQQRGGSYVFSPSARGSATSGRADRPA